MSRAHVVCAGLVTVDFVFSVPAYPLEGVKQRATGAATITGGGALNAAAAIVALGGNASLAGIVGDDMLGRFIREDVDARGIETSRLVALPGVATSRSAVFVTPDGERTVVNARDPRLFEFTPPVGLFDAVLTDSRWRRAAEVLLGAARAVGKPAVVDAEAPLGDFAHLLGQASHVAFSDQGLQDFAGTGDTPGLAEAARRLGNWTCVTRGAGPVLCHDGDRSDAVPTFACAAQDTLGAGDVWHGAFALALAEGRAARDGVRFANAAAGLSTEKAGHFPSREEVERLLTSSGRA